MSIFIEVDKFGETSFNEEVSVISTIKDELKALNYLRKKYSADYSRFILQQALLRKKALNKIPNDIVPKLYYEKSSLEQASSWKISEYRSNKALKSYRNCKRVWDLGSGIGIDTLNFAMNFEVNSVEIDDLRSEICQRNITSLGFNNRVKHINKDLTLCLKNISKDDLVFLDPARRDSTGKKTSISEYIPSLEIIHLILEKTQNIVVKISPAVDIQELESLLSGIEFQLEFISEDSQLKEAVLWFGDRFTLSKVATILPSEVSVDDSEEVIEYSENENCKFEYMFEPDFAVIRAGLVEQLAAKLDLFKIDDEIAYLGSHHELTVESLNFMRNNSQFKVIHVLENKIENLVQYLLIAGYNYVDIKKRGFDVDTDTLQKKINKKIVNKDKLKPVVIFFTYIGNIKKIIVTERL
jgi:predicted O-methyltransferase YrrM